MLIYRLVSWIFISAIGWVVFFFVFRTEKDIDPDAHLDDVGTDSRSSPPIPKPHSASPTPRSDACPPGLRTSRRSSGRARTRRGLRARRPERTTSSPSSVDRRRRRRRRPGGLTPVLASVVAAPVPVPATDGKIHLAYELLLTNALRQEVTLTSRRGQGRRPDAADADRRQARRTGPAPSGSPTPTTKLGPAQAGVVWLDVVARQVGRQCPPT